MCDVNNYIISISIFSFCNYIKKAKRKREKCYSLECTISTNEKQESRITVAFIVPEVNHEL